MLSLTILITVIAVIVFAKILLEFFTFLNFFKCFTFFFVNFFGKKFQTFLHTVARLFKTNVLLNFQKLISQICKYFSFKKYEKLLQCSFFNKKNVSVFCYKVIKHLTSWPLNELIKLTML